MIIAFIWWYRMRMASSAQELLAECGIRVTRQRARVLEALRAEPNDATAQDIYESLRKGRERIGLATVYRTLALLSEQGIVDVLMHHPGEVCYRLCGQGHHHHLTCTGCHEVIELGDCELEPWLAGLGGAHGFTVTSHAVEVAGICADCEKAAAAAS
jgi:Fur family ferric uptake transcriptional regulator